MRNYVSRFIFLFISISTFGIQRGWALSFHQFEQSLPLEITKGEAVVICSSVAVSAYKVLTAAHCIEGASEISLVKGFNLDASHPRFQAQSWRAHPQYNPDKSNYHFDIAVILLKRPLSLNIPYRRISKVKSDFPVVRVGFGGREGRNRRTIISGQKIIYSDEDYFELDDHYSVMGDSGGPIFQWQNGSYVLVGIHSTREGQSKTYAVHPFIGF